MNKKSGQIAFEAYRESVGGQAPDRKPIPEWKNLPAKTKQAWEAVTDRVSDQPALPATISAYAVLRPEQAPKGSQDWLRQQLADAGVTGYDVALQSVTSNGYVFSVVAEETKDNEVAMTAMFGTINTAVPEPQGAMMAPRSVWQVGGNWNGRFAQENPTPAGAK
ncbi:MAG: hypothetical protein E6Q97_15955 [Desulfurellales bacterium]|nr:MAG: hypothetical protein E6Q97_15955 [Desulfurellales bacterium]